MEIRFVGAREPARARFPGRKSISTRNSATRLFSLSFSLVLVVPSYSVWFIVGVSGRTRRFRERFFRGRSRDSKLRRTSNARHCGTICDRWSTCLVGVCDYSTRYSTSFAIPLFQQWKFFSILFILRLLSRWWLFNIVNNFCSYIYMVFYALSEISWNIISFVTAMTVVRFKMYTSQRD